MAQKVHLDAMIPRADFATVDEEFVLDLFQNFPINNLESGSPIRTMLRKPDFQRETNQWTPEQLATFIASFLDNELIPALILWKSPTHIFVIDGGHRLSALRAWIEDDYGDGPISIQFYRGEISKAQKAIAKRTRLLIEKKVGRFSTLKNIVNGGSASSEEQSRRAGKLFTRALALQWVQGNALVAETSFFKINSQGTPLDDTEEMLLRNRRKPVSIGARAIIRQGGGHKYWSAYPAEVQSKIEARAKELYELLFDPEVSQPIKTLDLPLGGSVSPIDALSLLIELLVVCDASQEGSKRIEQYDDDPTGDATVSILDRALQVVKRVTGTGAGSLGLHPAIYFYNERGKHSRFLFLGMIQAVTEKLRNNNSEWFKKFSLSRPKIEAFLLENKSLVGILLQNTARLSRVNRMAQMMDFLVSEFAAGKPVTAQGLLTSLGAQGRIFDITSSVNTTAFSDDSKSAIFLQQAVGAAPKCPLCSGLLYPRNSASYDHVTRVRDGGAGSVENGQLVHPYCNTSMKG